MRIKVRGGTVDHGQQSLCESCRWSTIIRGVKLGEQIVECNQLSYRNQRVPFHVMQCSRYGNRNDASLRDMEESAWILRSDVHRTKVGFIQSNKLPDEERYVLEED